MKKRFFVTILLGLLLAIIVSVPAVGSPQYLGAVFLTGGPTTTVKILTADLTYHGGIVRHAGWLAGMEAKPGKTERQEAPPGIPWPDDVHLAYSVDGVNKLKNIGPPVEPNRQYPLSPEEIMFEPAPVVAASNVYSVTGLLLVGLAVLAIVARSRLRITRAKQ